MFSMAVTTPPDADSPRSPQKRLDSSGEVKRRPRLPDSARISRAVSPNVSASPPQVMVSASPLAATFTASPAGMRTVGSEAR